MAFSKSIFISYCDDDKAIAMELRSFLVTMFDDEAWLKDFDLNGGEFIFESITTAITEAKCFIIIISEASLQCSWVKTEANLATIRSLENEDFKIIVIKLDKAKWPKYINFAFNDKLIVDLSEVQDRDNEYFKIANYIEKSGIIRNNS